MPERVQKSISFIFSPFFISPHYASHHPPPSPFHLSPPPCLSAPSYTVHYIPVLISPPPSFSLIYCTALPFPCSSDFAPSLPIPHPNPPPSYTLYLVLLLPRHSSHFPLSLLYLSQSLLPHSLSLFSLPPISPPSSSYLSSLLLLSLLPLPVSLSKALFKSAT